MKRAIPLQLTALTLCAFIISCGRSDESGSDSSVAGAVSATPLASESTAVTPAGSTSSPCPRTGRWARCSLEKRLEQSGFVLRKPDGEIPRRLGFSVPPLVYSLGRARLEVFIYPDEAALGRDLAQMDTTVGAPRGKTNDWEIPPRFMRSANLAAVFLTRNEQQAERVTLAITAGPPQK
ncbi:MAG: hypothetical protein ABIS15_04560 [Gemmatimonadaceae bacterium]